jgi:hypothetical protein
MNDFNTLPVQKPGKLIPILIGGLAITAISAIPIISMVNLLCCAGVMGGAIIGVWFYKKNFPPDMPFTVGDGATIGTLSGMTSGVLMTLVSALQFQLFSPDFRSIVESKIDLVMKQSSFQDPASADQLREMAMRLAATPAYVFLFLLILFVLLFTLFGLFGGLIGGGIFKTRTLPMPPVTPTSTPPEQF